MKNSKRGYKKWPRSIEDYPKKKNIKREYARNRSQNMSEEDTQKLREHKKKLIHCMSQKELQQRAEKLNRKHGRALE